MASFYYFAIFALFAVLTKAEGELGNSIEIIEDVQKYLSKNPEAKLIPLQRAAGPLKTMHYTLGNHIAGEKLVTQGNNNFYYSNPQNVKQDLWYPKSGLGARVSFIEIWVDQTSNIGNAYIKSGGIGQRHISLVIEANVTTLFRYRADIYGY